LRLNIDLNINSVKYEIKIIDIRVDAEEPNCDVSIGCPSGKTLGR
jgi:hypothetical protein